MSHRLHRLSEARICKENGCRKRVAGGNSLISYAARALGYCLYCYQGNFTPTKRVSIKKYLNPAQIRERHLRIHKEIARDLYDPAFFREWLELWEGESEV